MKPLLENRELVIKRRNPLVGGLVPGVDHPPVGLHDDCGAQVFVGVPPVGGTGGRTTGAQDALVKAVLETKRENY